jgi:hypothetical protein
MMYKIFGRFAATGVTAGGVGETSPEHDANATILATAAPSARSLGMVVNAAGCELELFIVVSAVVV